MPQTMLALLALMIAMTLSFNTQREVIHAQREMIANELEVMATGIALQTMETIRTRAFDEAVVRNPGAAHSTDDFEDASSTSDGEGEEASFTSDGEGNACKVFDAGSDECDDIDDFHGMQATRYFQMEETTRMPFDVTVEVRYVGAGLTAAGGETYQKEVTVYVQDAAGSGSVPFIRRPIRLSRIFAYGDRARAEGDLEGWFDDFMGWFMRMLDDDAFKAWAVGEAEAQGWTGLVPKIQNENEREIEQWFNRHPEAKEYIKAMWQDRTGD